ncbi:MAG: serine/threonine protein kinase [Myxococcales bacterium]|nr:serine/threonine protein kinase [Myxococcales bacterium]
MRASIVLTGAVTALTMNLLAMVSKRARAVEPEPPIRDNVPAMPASDEPGAKPELGFARTVVSRDGETLRDTVSVEELREAAPDASLPYIETIAPEDNRATGTPKSSAELAFVETTDLSAPSRNQLMPTDPEEGRVKAMIKARLFKSRAQPAKIGRFTILDRLGEGGMGVVYGAYDEQLDRKVAVKVLRPEVVQHSATGRVRLLREAQAMARLSHPNIVAVHEAGEEEGRIFVAMEFVRGQSLDRWIASAGERDTPRARPWREVLSVFLQAGRGLVAAHAAGIIHRDFKPHNAMISDEGVVKVLDFGLARASEARSEELFTTPVGVDTERGHLQRALTMTGAVLGTPAYMAPEQVHGAFPVTAATDVWALGVMLYEAIAGHIPCRGRTIQEILATTATGTHVPIDRVPGVDIDPELARAIEQALVADPTERIENAGALRSALLSAADPLATRSEVRIRTR